VIIQKNANYQTGADKQIPVMCIADLGDLTVTNNLNAAYVQQLDDIQTNEL